MSNFNSCGCCEGLSVETPVEVYNRPGLQAISYRVGNHSQFKESLLASLSISQLGALQELKTRSDDDFSIALLDAWATVSDVLTFYQERIANEAYLGTAIEQLSVLELARLIGYELRPGVAASTYVAFNLDEKSLSAGQAIVSGIARGKAEPVTTIIDSGTKIQSVPGPDEEPQNFETVEAIEALAEWNAMRPQLVQAQNTSTAEILVINGTDNNVKAGDMLLILEGNKLSKVLKIALDTDTRTTWLYLKPDASLPPFAPSTEYIPDGNPDEFAANTMMDNNVVGNIIGKTWTAETLTSLIKTQGWSVIDLKESIEAYYKTKAITEDKVFVFRRRATFFGYNAPLKITYPSGIPSQSEWGLESDELKETIFLDSTYDGILEGTYIAIQGLIIDGVKNPDGASIHEVEEVDHLARTAYGMSSKSTWLKIKDTPSPLPGPPGVNDTLKILRPSAINVQSESLPLALTPITDTVEGDLIRLSNLYLGLKKGRAVVFSGERADLPETYSNELAIIKEVYIHGGRSVLLLEKSLTYTYIRKNVTLNANVALATHGETVSEVLGNGDARTTFQNFKLKQPPLTFISAATPSGTTSTLEIRVNGILWTEVSSLYAHGPNERIYITRQNDKSETTVIFGDGKTGARLPTGQANILATYRKGIGTGGLLRVHQLSQLLSSPQGVKSVTNPMAATGAEDRESLADARNNATLTIFTLGRIVSLQDYEDFCRAFAGISKALAYWAWCGQKRCIHLTVAGTDGAKVDSGSELYKNLLDAIDGSGIPGVAVIVETYHPVFFSITARIKVHSDYESDTVLEMVEDKLSEQFSFAERAFGQAVSFSEVNSVIQNMEGVVAVDIDQFYRTDSAPGLEKNRLVAAAPSPGSLQLVAAELLTLDPSSIELNIMT